jgi:hypothetical protein
MKYRILFIDRATASAPKARAAVRLKLKVLNQSFNLIRNYLTEGGASFASSSLNQICPAMLTASNLR